MRKAKFRKRYIMKSHFCKTVKYCEFCICLFWLSTLEGENERKKKGRVFAVTYPCKTTCLCVSVQNELQGRIFTKMFTSYLRVVGWVCGWLFYFLPYTSLFLQSTCSVSVIRKRSDRTKKELTKGKIPFEMARNDNCLNFFFVLIT